MFTTTENTNIASHHLNEQTQGWVSSNGYPSIWDIQLSNFSSILTGSTITECIEKFSYNTKNTETKIVSVNKKMSGDYVVLESPLY